MTADDERRYNPFYDPEDADTGIFPDHNKDVHGAEEDFDALGNDYEREYYGPDHRDEGQYHDHECETCGTEIPEERTQCQSCATNDVPVDPATQRSLTRSKEELVQKIDQLVFAVVPGHSRFEAIVRGTRALNARDTGDKFPSDYDGDTFDLVHEFDDRTLIPFVRKWGALPDAAPLASERGLQLFTVARERTDWIDDTFSDDVEAPEADDEDAPKTIWELWESPNPNASISNDPAFHFFDESGVAIQARGQLVPLLEGYHVPEDPAEYTIAEMGSGEEELWLVPALTYKAVLEVPEEHRPVPGKNRERLYCDYCDAPTIHNYGEPQHLTPDIVEGQHPAGELTDLHADAETVTFHIWSCEACDGSRYAHDPEDDPLAIQDEAEAEDGGPGTSAT